MITRQDVHAENRSSQVVRAGHQIEIIARLNGSAFFSLARSVRIITAATASARVATYLGTPVIPEVTYEIPPNRRGCITFEQQGILMIWGEPSSVEIALSDFSLQRLSNISDVLQAMRWKASEKLQKAVHGQQSLAPSSGAPRVSLSAISRDFYTAWTARLKAVTVHKDFQAGTDSVDPRFLAFAERTSKLLRHPDLEIPRVLVLGIGSYAVSQYLCVRALENAAEPIYVELDPWTALTQNESAASIPLFTFAPGTVGFVGTSVGAVANPSYRPSAFHDRRGGLPALATGGAGCGFTLESSCASPAVMRSILADEGGYEPTTSLLHSSLELSSDGKCGGFLSSESPRLSDSSAATYQALRGIETVRNNALPPAVYDGRVCYYIGAGSGTLGSFPEKHPLYHHCAAAVAGSLMVQNCLRLDRSLTEHNVALARPQLPVSNVVDDTSAYSDSTKPLRTVASGLIVHGPQFMGNIDDAACTSSGTMTTETTATGIKDIMNQFSINVVLICFDKAKPEGRGYGEWLFHCVSALVATRFAEHTVHVMVTQDPFCITPRCTSVSPYAAQYCTAYWQDYFFGMPLTGLLEEQCGTTSGFGSGGVEFRLLTFVHSALASSVLRPCIVEVPYGVLRLSQYVTERLEEVDGQQVILKPLRDGPVPTSLEGRILAVIETERDDRTETTSNSKAPMEDEFSIDNAKWFPLRFFISVLAIHYSKPPCFSSAAAIPSQSSTAVSDAVLHGDTDVPSLDAVATVSLLFPFHVSQKIAVATLKKAVLVVGQDTLLSCLL